MNVLILDDEPAARRILSKLIDSMGHQVAVAADGMEGLRCLAQAPFDLVVTDHNMPMMSGAEFVRKARDIGHAVKIIVLSARVSPDDERRYHDLDVEDILTKPFGFKELIAILTGAAPSSSTKAGAIQQAPQTPAKRKAA
jgi:CheY-like chemotaxis protein